MRFIPLAIILIVFAVFAGYAIHEQSRELWFDEAFSMQTAELLNQGVDIDFSEYDVHPPLYYKLLAFWQNAWGDSVESSRWLSAILMMFFLACVYSGLSAFFSERVAYLTTATMALLTPYLHFGTEIRPYALVLFISALIFLAIADWLRKRDLVSWTIIIFAICLLPYVHYFSAMAGIFFAVLLFVLKEKKVAFAALAATLASGTLAFIEFTLPQIMRSEAMWFKKSTLSSWPSSVAYSLYTPQGNLFGDFYGLVFYGIMLVVFFGVGYGVWKMWQKNQSTRDKLIIMFILTSLFPFLWLLSGSLLSTIAGPGFGNVYHHRMFLAVTWMFAAGLLAAIYSWSESKESQFVQTVIPAVVIVVAVLLFLGPYQSSLHYELERTLNQLPCGHSVVVHESPFSGAPARVLEDCDNRHVVVSDLTVRQGRTAGYDAWPEEDILRDLQLPDENVFYYVQSEEPLEVIPEAWKEYVYRDAGISLVKVTKGAE